MCFRELLRMPWPTGQAALTQGIDIDIPKCPRKRSAREGYASWHDVRNVHLSVGSGEAVSMITTFGTMTDFHLKVGLAKGFRH